MFILQNSRGTPRVIIRFDKFISSAYRRICINRNRMVKSRMGTSPTLVFIKHLLQYIAEPRYITYDIFRIYTEDILKDVAMVSRKFDSTLSGVNVQSNLFIKNSTNEFLIPTSGIIGSQVSVLDDWNDWKNIQPIKMMTHNSRELDVLSYETQLSYNNDKPTYAVFCIDTAALLMKYIIYLRHFKLPLDNRNNEIDAFILDHVLSFLYDDITDVWVNNILLDLSEGKDIDASKVSNILNASEIYNASLDIKELIDKYKDGSLRFGDMMHTKFYTDKSVYDMLNIYNSIYGTYISNRYIGATLITNTPLLSFMVSLLDMTIYRQQETQYMRKVVIDLDILSRKNWETHVRSPVMIEEVNNLISKLEMLKTNSQNIP